MGDIPFGVSYYSADVFTRPNEFALDWAGGSRRRFVAAREHLFVV